jgi:hypothetical protein
MIKTSLGPTSGIGSTSSIIFDVWGLTSGGNNLPTVSDSLVGPLGVKPFAGGSANSGAYINGDSVNWDPSSNAYLPAGTVIGWNVDTSTGVVWANLQLIGLKS